MGGNMQREILELKKRVELLESYNQLNQDDKFMEQIREMVQLLNTIYNEKQNSYENKKNVNTNSMDPINEIEFIVKPFDYRMLNLDDTYVEKFSISRTNELERSNALKAHDKFWGTHYTVKGNIYGSFPLELADEKSLNMLKSFGWYVKKVKVYELGKVFDMESDGRAIINRFSKFMLIKEMNSKIFFLLDYGN
jgi:hypothetical protein